ncbi:thermoresistant gluconokinase family protein-like protein [Leptotrombidium deliense]|uniref:Gluconokinase n=1 Tax=Leptotrombidium deliense TaxID=299467 RepID=A0A443SD27_9ACAR|nr:thermoresistant gluconokinase family protein-like protein [Leptotrombidium deliense]
MVKVFIVFGPAGCGKTSVATSLAQAFNAPFIEGDTLHSKENIEKMRNGIPLTDNDRWQWLRSIRDNFVKLAQNLNADKLVFVTCSALKLSYRTVLREVGEKNITVAFICLRASRNNLSQRLTNRKGHYMSASMLDSQLEIFEEPKEDEPNVWFVDANQKLEDIISQLKNRINSSIL